MKQIEVIFLHLELSPVALTSHGFTVILATLPFRPCSSAACNIMCLWACCRNPEPDREKAKASNSLLTGRNPEQDQAQLELTMGRSCSLRNSGRLFLRRSLRKSSRVMMTAVMMKADTRAARRGSSFGVWCSIVAGRQTHHRDQLTSWSLKPGSFGFDKWHNFSFTSRLKVQQEPQQRRAERPRSCFICVIFRKSEHACFLCVDVAR